MDDSNPRELHDIAQEIIDDNSDALEDLLKDTELTDDEDFGDAEFPEEPSDEEFSDIEYF